MQVKTLLRLSVAVAVLTIVMKTAAWWITGSVGLLSDALESFVNLASALFALAMVTIAARPADDDASRRPDVGVEVARVGLEGDRSMLARGGHHLVGQQPVEQRARYR